MTADYFTRLFLTWGSWYRLGDNAQPWVGGKSSSAVNHLACICQARVNTLTAEVKGATPC